MLDRIIKASSNEGDVVFDPFCGCTTTLEAAHKLGRRWIGIDIAIHAIKRVAKIRLQDKLGLVEDRDFVIDGVPRTLEGAKDLWTHDKYHFQKWAVEEIDGFVTTKRTADGGIDGRLYFVVPGAQDLQSMAIEVKGGKNVSFGMSGRSGASWTMTRPPWPASSSCTRSRRRRSGISRSSWPEPETWTCLA